ncbi:RimK family alpha-L-glutamate ligase [Methanoculleus sp. MH98A]|uniref:ATP-grasp domain-containing protein n=1 Tax=Methanoculleus sp. MH98A TaxID=1495314 RepID=UPI00049F1D00|nr:ATP-grasp domain-containing protein [Methanoculleus sp. MH98A]KDE56171.1 peptidase S6 [Methanoculleus sp. MH98A]
MIHIVPKPTDTPDDNSTGAVMRELERAGARYGVLKLGAVDPLDSGLENELVWVCGIRQDGHQFETLNVLSLHNRVINTPESIVACASKVMTTALLLANNVRTPETAYMQSEERAREFLLRHGKVVYKPLYGYDGNGIRLVTEPGELGPGPWYLQEYVKNDRDFRVFVLGGEAVGAIARVSDTLMHNIHQGGTGMPVAIDEEMRATAESAAAAIGIDYCGVDLLRDREGYTVLEVNGTPNWHCMAAPIPELLARYLIEREREMRA